MMALVQILAVSLLAVCLASHGTCRSASCDQAQQRTLEDDQVTLLQIEADIKPGAKHHKHHQRHHRGHHHGHHHKHHGDHRHHHVNDATQFLAGDSTAYGTKPKDTIGAPDAIVHAAAAYNALQKLGDTTGGDGSVNSGALMSFAKTAQQMMNDATQNPTELSIVANQLGGGDGAFGQGTPFPTAQAAGVPKGLHGGAGQTYFPPTVEAPPDQYPAGPPAQSGIPAEIGNNIQYATAYQHDYDQDQENHRQPGQFVGVPQPMPIVVPPPSVCPANHIYLSNGQGDDQFWRCVDGTCIIAPGRCDERQDCADGSDELYCNKALFAKVHALEMQNSDLTDEIMGLRTGGAKHAAEFNSLNVLMHALNNSLRSDFANLQAKTAPHLEMQSHVEANEKKVADLQIKLDQLKNHDDERVQDVNVLLGKNSALITAMNDLKRQNEELKSSVSLIKEDYVKLQVDVHNSR
jgi:hypothetical protein